mmetsp:Transcript_29456/g.48315  ORF Transcript_29456/g.48315 Transcript_29456/m.48315 type:complete len:240 (-) Transcript_29456:362-1081(-)
MAADFSWSSSPLWMPLLFSLFSRLDSLDPSLGDFLNTFSAFWTLDSRSLATKRSEEPVDFIKARWARHAFRSWAVSTSLPRWTEENEWHTSSSFLHDLRVLFRRLPGNDSGGNRSLGMLAANFCVEEFNLPHSRPMFFPRNAASCCIFPPTLPRPCLTLLPTSWMGLMPGLRCLRGCLCFFVVLAALVAATVAEPPRRNGSGMRSRGAPSAFVMHSPSKRREIKKPILLFRMMMNNDVV